jgi:hypothetical protein
MSRSIAKRLVIIPSDLGGMTVSTELLIDYDIEEIVKSKAESQALILQMANLGKDIKPAMPGANVLTSIYTELEEDLDE